MASDRPSPNAKQVFWFNDGKTPNVADVLDNEPEVTMHRLEFKTPDAENWPIIEPSHVYCITSTRDEVPDQYKADETFLKRCPDLLVVSTSGAGYDPVDVDACTKAGVPCELHLYETGGHGFFSSSDQWQAALDKWLRARGVLPKK